MHHHHHHQPDDADHPGSPESDLLHQLFRENVELRAKWNASQRELFNKTVQIEAVEDELRLLKLAKDDGKSKAALGAMPAHKARRVSRISSALEAAATANSGQAANQAPVLSKELEEVMSAMERKNAEIKHFREEIGRLQMQIERQRADYGEAERLVQELQEELHEARAQQSAVGANAEAGDGDAGPAPGDAANEMAAMQRKLTASDETVAKLRRQLLELATDANRKHNEQQNQLQGVEALIDVVKREYDEFLKVQQLENMEYRNTHQVESDRLKRMYDETIIDQHEDRRKMIYEYQGLLYGLQAQFEEYRTTAEFLFNVEVTKLEEELTSQAMRYEQEIMYIIQAKDRFYSDLMVGKDAKIMSLIEGSDLQSLMQKHEMDIEVLRKEHAREIDRVKLDQETEQKNLIGLLQRNNSSLESKCDKLQAHIKTLEVRIKDLLGTIDNKNRLISEREEAKIRSDAEFQRLLDIANEKANALSQEKEHLRHKVIRLNLDARGEGENTIENMLKRISRETAEIQVSFEDMSTKYEFLLSEHQSLSKRYREKENLASFLEKEIKRRNKEITTMTQTFENFLLARARHTARARRAQLARRGKERERVREVERVNLEKEGGGDLALFTLCGRRGGAGDGHAAPVPMSADELVASLRQEGRRITAGRKASGTSEARSPEFVQEKTELERGYAYLRRFKTLSRALVTGDFRQVPAVPSGPLDTGMYQRVNVYAKLDAPVLSSPKFYKDNPRAAEDLKSYSGKAALYNPNKAGRDKGGNQGYDVHLKTPYQLTNRTQNIPSTPTNASKAGGETVWKGKDRNALSGPMITGHFGPGGSPNAKSGMAAAGTASRAETADHPPRLRSGAWAPTTVGKTVRTPVTVPGASMIADDPSPAGGSAGALRAGTATTAGSTAKYPLDFLGMAGPSAKSLTPEKRSAPLSPAWAGS